MTEPDLSVSRTGLLAHRLAAAEAHLPQAVGAQTPSQPASPSTDEFTLAALTTRWRR